MTMLPAPSAARLQPPTSLPSWAHAQIRLPSQRGDDCAASCSHPAAVVSRQRGRGPVAPASSNGATAVQDRPEVADKIPNLPFVKLAGQTDMKLALMLNIIDKTIGGVYIVGDRGTGKSVAVRAMADLLPEIEVVADDPFNSHPTDTTLMGQEAQQALETGEQLRVVRVETPLVELPLGATEDRICGSINIEKALQEGTKAFEPGLLARANRGILYIDEVNLLDDGLVDVVLDSAASGRNAVEREGVSIQHPAKFIMIGSGNDQEGELRPQLLDRFGLSVHVSTIMDVDTRTQMVLDRLAYDQDPVAFCEAAAQEQAALRDKLEGATARLEAVETPDDIRLQISEVCSLLEVDGIRGDITVNRSARALAALEERAVITREDVQRVLALCLNHRMKKDPLSPIDSGAKVQMAFRRITDPERAKKEAAEAARAKKAQEEAAKVEADRAAGNSRAGKKAGSWGGL